VEKLEGKIKRSLCISERAFMLKCYPLCQHYARFLIVPIYTNNYSGTFDAGLNVIEFTSYQYLHLV